MSVNHGSIATHVPQSLPSFAQAFSTQSLDNISARNIALPPIQSRLPPMDNRSPSTKSLSRPSSEENPGPNPSTSRKRPRNDVTSASRDDDLDNEESPRLVHIKEEQDQELLQSTPLPPTPRNDNDDLDSAGAPPPSSLRPSPSKRRRVTISGAPHPLNTNVRAPVDQTNSTPISPVVMGFTIKRDNPTAIEQVRSMITVKQKQKALIEQRRGSVAGVLSPSVATGNPIPLTPVEDRNPVIPKPPTSTRSLRRSPNTGTGPRRMTTSTPSQNPGNPRPPSPSPIVVPSQQPVPAPAPPPPPLPLPSQASGAHSLPPPPISFARRRAGLLGSAKKKPADILISPRDSQTQEQFQPAIQSAPPVPHAAQGGSFHSGRFPMALPRLPSVMGGGDNVRRVASNVPPTPTRLAMRRSGQNSATPQPIPSLSGRSPPAASVPIASTLVPPTPSSLHRPGYSGDKSAFLAPFGVFYDALNDSKQLKDWLVEQLQKSNSLMQMLTQQQEKLDEVVQGLVEKKVSGMRSEISGLHRRVEELEDALRLATSGNRQSSENSGGIKPKGKPPFRNGIITDPMASETYTFPPVTPTAVDSSRQRPDLSRGSSGQDRDRDREHHNMQRSEDGPYDSTRASISASRLDPPRPQLSESLSQPRTSFAKSPPQVFRDSPNRNLPPHPRPTLSRQSSSHGLSSNEQVGSPPLRRSGSRRNSVIMSPPDAPEGSD